MLQETFAVVRTRGRGWSVEAREAAERPSGPRTAPPGQGTAQATRPWCPGWQSLVLHSTAVTSATRESPLGQCPVGRSKAGFALVTQPLSAPVSFHAARAHGQVHDWLDWGVEVWGGRPLHCFRKQAFS